VTLVIVDKELARTVGRTRRDLLLGGTTAAVSFLIGWIVEDFMASSEAAGGLH
jgi:hypothetical protein